MIAENLFRIDHNVNKAKQKPTKTQRAKDKRRKVHNLSDLKAQIYANAIE